MFLKSKQSLLHPATMFQLLVLAFIIKLHAHSNIFHLTILSFGHCLDKFVKCKQCTRLKKIYKRNICQINDFPNYLVYTPRIKKMGSRLTQGFSLQKHIYLNVWESLIFPYFSDSYQVYLVMDFRSLYFKLIFLMKVDVQFFEQQHILQIFCCRT